MNSITIPIPSVTTRQKWIAGAIVAGVISTVGVGHWIDKRFFPQLSVPATAQGTPGRILDIPIKAPSRLSIVFCSGPTTPDIRISGNTLIFTAPTQGDYRFAVSAVKWGRPVGPAYCTVHLGPPDPNPGPGPSPGPTPQAGKLWIYMVVDNSAMTQQVAQIEQAESTWKDLQSRGHHYRIFDISDPEIDKLNLRKYVTAAGGPPAAVFTDMAGHVLNSGKAFKLPSDANGVVSLVKQVGGD